LNEVIFPGKALLSLSKDINGRSIRD